MEFKIKISLLERPFDFEESVFEKNQRFSRGFPEVFQRFVDFRFLVDFFCICSMLIMVIMHKNVIKSNFEL